MLEFVCLSLCSFQGALKSLSSFEVRSLKTIQRSDHKGSVFNRSYGLSTCRSSLSAASLALPLRPGSTWDLNAAFRQHPLLPRKEVIQPHLPIRLPCYDFTPVIGLTLDACSLSVRSTALGAPNSHGVTGGVYKARERIHRDILIRDY